MPLKESAHSETGRKLHNDALMLGLEAAYLSNEAYDELVSATELNTSVLQAETLVGSVNGRALERGMDEIVSIDKKPWNTSLAKLQEQNAKLRFEQFSNIAGIILGELSTIEFFS